MFFKRKNEKCKNKGIGKFEKVPFDQFKKDMIKLFGDMDEDMLSFIYDNIKLPVRSTAKSSGYDFFAPFGINIKKYENIVIPTGIRAIIDDNYYLGLYPRSGMGFKYRVALANTVGIIDADYSDADNYGHIMAKICYDGIDKNSVIVLSENSNPEEIIFDTYTDKEDSNKLLTIRQSDRFIQGIFTPYGITIDDNATGKRTGGEGSTGK